MKKILTPTLALISAFILAIAFVPSTAAVNIPVNTFIAISAGSRHNLVVKSDGSLWAWGNNSDGQLGDGTFGDFYGYELPPVKVMDDVAAVSAGTDHSMAIKSDGSLWAWGNNFSGQIGDGTISQYEYDDDWNRISVINAKYTPVKVMEDVTAVSAGANHSMAIKSDGSLWAWGDNYYGQIGDGTAKQRLTPVKVMDNVVAISAGSWHSFAIKSDGSLWAWGLNSEGQLGNGKVDEAYLELMIKVTPIKIMDDTIAVSAGWLHSLAIKSDGSLWAWGYNDNGQIGDGTINEYFYYSDYLDKAKPIKIMDNAVAVSAGYRYSTAIKSDGSLWCWGISNPPASIDGRVLGDFKLKPFKAMENIATVSAGSEEGMAIKNDGSLWVWGNNFSLKPEKMTSDLRIPVPKVGDILGEVKHTDIVAYINGEAIPTHNVNNDTYVVVEDLKNYGFAVDWDGKERTLNIVGFNKNRKVTPMPLPQENIKTGTFKCHYVYTDIKTYISGELVESYNINGQTLIDFELLKAYGTVTWDGEKRELRLVEK